MQNQTSPLILSFGLSDPVGATGTQADLATFAALSCHGLSVATALLIGDTARVEEVQTIEPDWVSDQARVLLEDMRIDAIKIGAPGGTEHITAIAEIVSDYPGLPLVLDPFASALPEQGIDSEDMLMALRQLLVPQATVLVLSQVELERLAETWRDSNLEDTLRADVDFLLELGCAYVLVTGTPHAAPGQPAQRANTLFGPDGVIGHQPWQHLAGSFLGAGGLLSAALTAMLAGPDYPDPARAVLAAQQYTAGALAHARRFGMGKLMPDRFFQRRGDALQSR
ncbi:MAG: hydroxymethylpyrimidine/phosphomethylpyrimidine kinase [Pseudomonadota bacterium]